MFKIFRKLKKTKAQTLLEYAITIGLAAAVFLAIQTYVGRAVKGQLRATAGEYMTGEIDTALGTSMDNQYAEYYADREYDIETSSTTTERLDLNVTSMSEDSVQTRKAGGRDITAYDSYGLRNGT